MIKFYTFGILLFFSVTTLIAQNNEGISKTNKQQLTKSEKPCLTCPGKKTDKPEDFPKFVDTGNPDKDAARFDEQKRQWIENNPEKYKAMFPEREGSQADKLEKAKKEALRKKNN